jgi:hypothetical protein
VLLYDAETTPYLRERFTWIGTWRGPRSRALDFLRALLATRHLVLVAVGPPAAPLGYRVVDSNNPSTTARPLVLDERDVLGHERAEGMYVITTLRVHDAVDPDRMRQALSMFTTGRLQSVRGSASLVVADWAPVVATMKRALDEINAIAESSAAHEESPAPRVDRASAR